MPSRKKRTAAAAEIGTSPVTKKNGSSGVATNSTAAPYDKDVEDKDPIHGLHEKMRVVSERMGEDGFLQTMSAPGDGADESDHDEEEDNDEDNGNANKKKMTKEQVARLRFFHMPSERMKAMTRMEKQILGSQYGDSILMFNTSFSYHVFDVLMKKIPQIERMKNKKKAFNELLGLTCAIHENDVWMTDNEDPEESAALMQRLASVWKSFLMCDDASLGIDPEFTRPAVEQKLATIEVMCHDLPDCYRMDFNWR